MAISDTQLRNLKIEILYLIRKEHELPPDSCVDEVVAILEDRAKHDE